MNSNDEFRFNEILFENRNKKYGAYALRMEEGNMLKKSLFIGVAFFACLSLAPVLVNAFASPVIANPVSDEYVYKPVDLPPVKTPEIVKPITPVAPPKVNTYNSQVATPTRDAKESKDPAPPKDSDAIAGFENIVGVPPITITKPPVIDIVGPPEIAKPPVIDDKAIVKNVDVEAAFTGGINAFRTKVVQNFGVDNFEGTNELMKTTVSFIVEKDGTISEVKASGPNAAFNKEAEKTVKSVKGKWLPAKFEGKNVRSYFKFPISMQFE